jgi:hypothetical protein
VKLTVTTVGVTLILEEIMPAITFAKPKYPFAKPKYA